MDKEKVTLRSVPLSIQLEEGNVYQQIPERVQLMRTGTFYDKRYGKVDVTREIFENMVVKFDEGVRGIDLMIDYKHDSDAEAAGWIKSLDIVDEPNDNGEGIKESQLWASVDWTPNGRQKLSDKEFAYLSADFDPDYRDNENPETSHGAVLLGAALTNRPVIKRMAPAIQLSENETSTTYKEKKSMDIDEKKMGDDMKKLEEDKKLMEDKLEKVDAFMKEIGVESIEDLMKMIADLRKENESMLMEKKMSERKETLNVLLNEGKINAAQREEALKLDDGKFEGFVSIIKMSETKVKMSESGENKTQKEEKVEDPQEKVIELAEKVMDDKKVSFSEATAIVLKENKELAKAYNESV